MDNQMNSYHADTSQPLNGIAIFERASDSECPLQDYLLHDLSDLVARIFEHDKAAITGKSLSQLLPEMNAGLQEMFSSILTLGKECETEYFSTQTQCWYKAVVHFFDRRFCLSFNDISIYKRVDYSLDTFFDFNLEMFSIFDKNGKCIRMNNEWVNVLGYTLDELNQFSYAAFIHPDDLNFTYAVISNFTENQKIFDFTNRIRAKDGSYKHIEWRSCFINGLLYSSSRDITQLKLREDEIENQENLRQIVEHLDGVFFLMNAAMTRTLYITPNYPEVFGEGHFTDSTYVALIQKIIHRDDLEKFNNNMITYQSTGVIKEEYRIWKSKKECIRVYASVFQIVNKSGEVIRHAGFVHKITTGK